MSNFEIVDIPEQPCLFVRGTVAQADLGNFFMDALPKVFGVAAAQNAIGGAPSARYTDWREADCDVEAYLPTTHPIEGEGDVQSGTCGGFRALKTMHVGPYDQLSETHGKLHSYVTENNVQMAGPPSESYIDDPSEVPPDQVRTEVFWPIV